MSQMLRFGHALMDYSEGREPENYPGQYTREMALDIIETYRPATVEEWAWIGAHRTVAKQKKDMGAFGVEFDTWFYESTLHDPGISFLRDRCLSGDLFKTGVNGQPVCALCGRSATYRVGCLGNPQGAIEPCIDCNEVFAR